MDPEEIAAQLARKKAEREARLLSTVNEPNQNGAQAAHEPTVPRGGSEPLPEEREARPVKPQRRVMGSSPTGPPQDIHRSPPHSSEAEQGVLGSMLLSPRDVIAEVVARITDAYFYIPHHQAIFNELVKMWDKGEAIDLITFTQHMRDVGQLDSVGGPSFITSLYTFVPTAANANYYLDIIRDKYLLREVIATCTEGVRRSYEEQDEVNNLIDEVEHKIFTVGDMRFKTDVQSMKDNVMRAVQTMSDAYDRKGGITGIATGFAELDRMAGGLQRSEMIVIAARPSMGKTALAMNIAEHVSLTGGLPVAVFSLEMSVDQLTQRMLCSRARVNLQKVRDGFMSERDFPALTVAAAKLAGAKMFIDDSSSITILELRAKARRLKAQHDIQLVIVDYLQLLRSTSKKSQDNRQIEVSEISAGLKGLAKELKVPVIVAAQLNRNPENRTGDSKGRPRLSDLRESGSIEQDADLVGLLFRAEVYEHDEDARAEVAGEAELIIAKQRNGPLGEIPLTFIKEFTRFEDRAKNYSADEPEGSLL